MQMNFAVAKLKETLAANRKKHAAAVVEAKQDYHKALVAEYEGKLKRIKAGNYTELSPELDKPHDYTKSYDKIIQMLEYTSDENIVLSDQQFQNYVMDQWSWTEMFNSSISSYKRAL